MRSERDKDTSLQKKRRRTNTTVVVRGRQHGGVSGEGEKVPKDKMKQSQMFLSRWLVK